MIKIKKKNLNTKRSVSAPPLVPANEKELKKSIGQAIKYYKLKFGKPEIGRHRIVFIDTKNNQVIKIPISDSGISANFQELDEQNENLAITELDEKKSIEFGIPILKMELVRPILLSELKGKIPSWIYSIDSSQVGYTKDGRLVAYDWDHY